MNFRGKSLINMQLLNARCIEEVWVPRQFVMKASLPASEKTLPLISLLSNHVSPPLFAVSFVVSTDSPKGRAAVETDLRNPSEMLTEEANFSGKCIMEPLIISDD